MSYQGVGGKILMILSPAKTLDLKPLVRSVTTTRPECCGQPSKMRNIARAMKAKSQGDLAKLLGISKNLAGIAFEYWNEFKIDEGLGRNDGGKEENVNEGPRNHNKPCVFCFSGPAYQGLNPNDFNDEELHFLQQSLRIVDPLYGLLRPLDVIQPYRLEMATKGLKLRNEEGGHNDEDDDDNKTAVRLSEYWKPVVMAQLQKELEDGPDSGSNFLLNLASDEYSAAIDASQLLDNSNNNNNNNNNSKVIKVVFREQGRVIAVHAKRARGLMARHITTTRATMLEDVRKFDLEGYQFVPSDSSDTTLVFDRSKDWKTKAAQVEASSTSNANEMRTKRQKASAKKSNNKRRKTR